MHTDCPACRAHFRDMYERSGAFGMAVTFWAIAVSLCVSPWEAADYYLSAFHNAEHRG
jgi:hypothetical protein